MYFYFLPTLCNTYSAYTGLNRECYEHVTFGFISTTLPQFSLICVFQRAYLRTAHFIITIQTVSLAITLPLHRQTASCVLTGELPFVTSSLKLSIWSYIWCLFSDIRLNFCMNCYVTKEKNYNHIIFLYNENILILE